jgi:uncharacterized membrane protein
MTDYTAPNARVGDPPVTAILIAYLLLAITAIGAVISSGLVNFLPLFALTAIAAVIIIYVKRDEARGTWLESHCSWLLRTFWWSLFWDLLVVLVGGILILVLIGFLLLPLGLALVSIWVLYRLIRGYLAFRESRPVGV